MIHRIILTTILFISLLVMSSCYKRKDLVELEGCIINYIALIPIDRHKRSISVYDPKTKETASYAVFNYEVAKYSVGDTIKLPLKYQTKCTEE